MTALIRFFQGGFDSSRGYLALYPTGSTTPGKLPTHHANGSSGSACREAPPPSAGRSKVITGLLVGGVALLAVWADRTAIRKHEQYSMAKWMHRTIDPSMGSQRSQIASLKEVCDAPSGSRTGTGTGVEVGTMDVGMDRMMSEGKCNIAFPALYKELDRAVAHYGERGHIKKKELDAAILHGHARVLIHDNRVFIKQFEGGPGKRTEAALNAIQEAVITSPETLPNVEFVIKTTDKPEGGDDDSPLWVLDRREGQKELWLMPDYGFYSWPEPGVGGITEVRDKCADWESKQSWKDKIPKLFWRGAILVKLREEMLDIVKGHKWNEVAAIVWGNLGGMLKTPEEHCAYKYLLHAEGYAYSGRLKYLQMCRSVIVAHDMEFIQHFHHLFDATPGSPTQNMVLAPGPGFQGLPQVMQELIDDDSRAEKIANNSYELFRHYLSPAAVNCYWRQAFRTWAAVQAFEPTRQATDTSFESFNLMHAVHWDPY